MDCLTISNFRNLERQAIRQCYNENFARELVNNRYASFNKSDALVRENSNKNSNIDTQIEPSIDYTI